jgi:hypothetical protein
MWVYPQHRLLSSLMAHHSAPLTTREFHDARLSLNKLTLVLNGMDPKLASKHSRVAPLDWSDCLVRTSPPIPPPLVAPQQPSTHPPTSAVHIFTYPPPSALYTSRLGFC